jgi:hypothetical protein
MGAIRLVAAGCFVYGGLLAAFAMASTRGVAQPPPWLMAATIGLAGIALILVALWLFNLRPLHRGAVRTREQELRDLEARGLVESTDFRVTRAFGVDEFEDEGIHYYLELTDGRVLFLSGQYLYEFEPIGDDPEANQPRLFPCSEFTLRTHKAEHYVLDVQRRGVVIEPELIAPPFTDEDWDRKRVPGDGQVISDRSYEELKRERLAAADLR